MIADPPLLPGGLKAMLACPAPGDAVPISGAPGTMAGVTLTVCDGALVPTVLVAVTEQVWVVPLARPVTVIGEAAPVAAIAPGLQVTV